MSSTAGGGRSRSIGRLTHAYRSPLFRFDRLQPLVELPLMAFKVKGGIRPQTPWLIAWSSENRCSSKLGPLVVSIDIRNDD
jgi:hypothetical protein